MDYKKTGEFIAAIRKEKGQTQRELADALHISHTTVSKWERGMGFPDISIIEPLADSLGISITELFRGERAPANVESEGLLSDAVRLSNAQLSRARKRAWAASIAAIIPIAVALALLVMGIMGVFDVPTIRGSYQSAMMDGYVVQFAIQDMGGETTFVQYINNYPVDQGTWSKNNDSSYNLYGEIQTLVVVLNPDNSFSVRVPGLNSGMPISMAKLGDVPLYFDPYLTDEGNQLYRGMLNEQ